jgi:hypothetical protein
VDGGFDDTADHGVTRKKGRCLWPPFFLCARCDPQPRTTPNRCPAKAGAHTHVSLRQAASVARHGTDPLKVGKLLRVIGGYDGQPTAAALELAPTFCTTRGLRAVEWPEFVFDNEQSEWLISASRIKYGRRTSSRCRYGLSEVCRGWGGSPAASAMCFPQSGGDGRPLSENTLNGELRRSVYSGNEMTVHGLHSIVSIFLNAHGVLPGRTPRRCLGGPYRRTEGRAQPCVWSIR